MLHLFTEGVNQLGLPSRVHANRGGENVAVAMFMLLNPLRRPGRGSFITGRSIHNRLCYDVMCSVNAPFFSTISFISWRLMVFECRKCTTHILPALHLSKTSRSSIEKVYKCMESPSLVYGTKSLANPIVDSRLCQNYRLDLYVATLSF